MVDLTLDLQEYKRTNIIAKSRRQEKLKQLHTFRRPDALGTMRL